MTSSQPRLRRLVLASLAALLLALAALAPAQAGAAEGSPFLKAIRVNQSTEDGLGPLLAKFNTLQCGLYGKGGNKKFHAFANSGKYRLTVFILDAWQGFKPTYDLHYASDDPVVRLFTPSGEVFSNENPLPGAAWTGLIDFKSGGDKIALALVPAMNPSATAQVTIIGHAKCSWRTPRK